MSGLLVACMVTSLAMLAGDGQQVVHGQQGKGKFANPPMPTFRVVENGFDAGRRDIRAVLESAGRELWKHFPDHKIEPMLIMRGKGGPITLFKRTDRGEIIVRLDTHRTFWSQYAYQFAHEFCHVLCGYRNDGRENKWFEEMLCETASLYVMRAMARSWKNDPPYSNWKDYRDALRNYADDVIRKRTEVNEIYDKGMAGFYKAHEKQLRAKSTLRELNGAMAIVFMRLFEQEPVSWEAIRWLNHKPAPKGLSFEQYLQRWREAVPQRHKAFVGKVGKLYGYTLK